MRVPSTRTQVLVVWTVICAGIVIGLKLASDAAASPADCFECGFGRYLLESGLTLVVIVWAIVAILVLLRRPDATP